MRGRNGRQTPELPISRIAKEVPVSPPILVRYPAQETSPRTAWTGIALVALCVAVLHLATNGRYGFHRDELQFLSDARHLDWGFVAYPPFTPFIERVGLAIFGLS